MTKPILYEKIIGRLSKFTPSDYFGGFLAKGRKPPKLDKISIPQIIINANHMAYRYRSSVTGRMVKKSYAEKHSRITEKERVKKK